MGNTPKFSFIIAGYQNEPYLPKALGSVSAQTFRDFEAICYVEESTDRSLEICRDMAARDPRFRVLTGPKSGAVATTRNVGIDNARGEYLVVLDGDDWVVPGMLEKLAAKLALTGSVDVLAFAAAKTRGDAADLAAAERITNFRPADANDVFSGVDAIRRSAHVGGRFSNYTWLNIYRTAFLRENGIRQADGLLMEDVESTPRIWFAARRFAYLDETLYVYRLRPDSITTVRSTARVNLDLARNIRSGIEFAMRGDVPDDVASVWFNQWTATIYAGLFFPGFARRLTDADRRRILSALLDGEGKKLFVLAVARASRPKRIVLPFVLLAARGWMLPAKLVFRAYYALSKGAR